MYNGIINIYKEKGFTSHDVVAKLRGILSQKKIGHTGTLDPDAEGVLPVCLGIGTKLSDLLTDKDKEYRALMLLGKTTDTQDISGNVLSETEPERDAEKIREAILSFQGEYLQTPPMYSAIKVGGRKLCDIARNGGEVERKPRRVRILSIDIESIDSPLVEMRVRCSKGTYIRTLCDDIGKKLGCGACLTELTRTASGSFGIESALKLSEIEAKVKEGALKEYIVPVDELLKNYPRYDSTGEASDKLLINGAALPQGSIKGADGLKIKSGDKIRVYDSSGSFIALYEYRGKYYSNFKMFGKQ